MNKPSGEANAHPRPSEWQDAGLPATAGKFSRSFLMSGWKHLRTFSNDSTAAAEGVSVWSAGRGLLDVLLPSRAAWCMVYFAC